MGPSTAILALRRVLGFRSIAVAVVCLCIASSMGCREDRQSPTGVTERGVDPVARRGRENSMLYSYKGFSRSGELVVTGDLAIEGAIRKGEPFRGTWRFNNVGTAETKDWRSPKYIGPQDGSGSFIGKWDDSLVMEFQQAVDNNIVLIGDLAGDQITGRWEFHTDAGVSNTGTFKAVAARSGR